MATDPKTFFIDTLTGEPDAVGPWKTTDGVPDGNRADYRQWPLGHLGDDKITALRAFVEKVHESIDAEELTAQANAHLGRETSPLGLIESGHIAQVEIWNSEDTLGVLDFQPLVDALLEEARKQ